MVQTYVNDGHFSVLSIRHLRSEKVQQEVAMEFLGKVLIECSINAPEMFIKVSRASDNTYCF